MARQSGEELMELIRQCSTHLELQQFQYFDGRPIWTTIKLNDLKLFMAYTYFGYPFDENDEIDESNDDLFSFYPNETKKIILDMYDIIKTKIVKKLDSENIEVGITITHSICSRKCVVCNNLQNIHQWYLVRIKLNHYEVSYIDLHHQRTYKNWNDYIENNSLPIGFMFYPESGFYDESNYLSQNLTPPSRTKEKVLNGLDLVGKAAGFSSSILLAGGLIFPVMAPVLIPASLTIGSVSAYEVGRQISKLTDLSQHNQSLVGKEASKHWFDLGISTLGVLTAPMNTAIRTLQLSESAVMTTALGKSLSILQKSACIAQCSLEILRCTIVRKENGKFTLKDIISLRLDLFIVLGTLLPTAFIQSLFEYIATTIPLTQICSTISTIPYCAGKLLFVTVSYIKKHAAEFAAAAEKFFRENLTPEKMLSAWLQFRRFLDAYREAIGRNGPEDVLRHVAYDLVALPAPPRSGRPGAAVWEAELRAALCGPDMRDLLHRLAVQPSDLRAVGFCAELVAAEAAALAAQRDDAADVCAARHVETDPATIDREFRRVHGNEQDAAAAADSDHSAAAVARGDGDVDGRIMAAWYVRCGVRAIAADVPGFWCRYREHQSRPDRPLDDQLVVEYRGAGGSSVRAFRTAAPTVDGSLDATTCAGFARAYDPENPDGYRGYRMFADGRADGSTLLWSASAMSVNVAFFSVQSSRPGDLPCMNVCIYRCPK